MSKRAGLTTRRPKKITITVFALVEITEQRLEIRKKPMRISPKVKAAGMNFNISSPA
jgi:hypothetical protein